MSLSNGLSDSFSNGRIILRSVVLLAGIGVGSNFLVIIIRLERSVIYFSDIKCSLRLKSVSVFVIINGLISRINASVAVVI